MKKFWLRGEFLGTKSKEFTWFFRSFGNCTFSQWVEINSEEAFLFQEIFIKHSYLPWGKEEIFLKDKALVLHDYRLTFKIATTWVCFPDQSTPKLLTKNIFVGMQDVA